MVTCTRNGKRAKVILSQLTNVYKNLALENWLLKNWSFCGLDCLLVYQNKPCVVVGRFQNPWREADVQRAKQAGIAIARRVSGGGTVYHDLGNVNFSFYTDKASYCPARNLQLLAGTLNSRYSIPVQLNQRNDLVIGASKISGSASRITRTGSFHHCTLLVNSDLSSLSAMLRGDTTLESSATLSVSSPTTTLASHSPGDVIKADDVITHVTTDYLSLYNIVQPTTPAVWDSRQDADSSVVVVDNITDNVADGEHESYSWVFGKSPKFVKRIVREGGGLVNVHVENGLIKQLEGLETEQQNNTSVTMVTTRQLEIQHNINNLIGERYELDKIRNILQSENLIKGLFDC